MGLHAYIQGFSSLESIDRAPGYFKYQHHSVAAHCFRTAELAQIMGDIEEVIGGQKINWKALYEKSLNHDYTERFIGDIKTPVKYATPELRKMIGEVEETMTAKFSNERTCKRNRDVQGLSCGFEDKYFFCMSLFLFQFEYMNVAMIHFCLHFHVKVAFVNAHAFYIVAISTSEVDVVFLDHFMCPQINNADSHSV